MALYMMMGTLAAFGALCALWILTGMWRTGSAGGVILYRWRTERAGRAFVLRCRVIRELGLFSGAVIVVGRGLTAGERAWLERYGRGIEICSPDALAERLELEIHDGTGNGDYPGRHQRRGLPEL